MRLFSPWDSPGKNTKADCHFLLQGIFPTQGLDLHLLPAILYCCITLNLLNGLLRSTPLLECFLPYLHEAVCCCSLVTSFCSNVITCSDVCPQKDPVLETDWRELLFPTPGDLPDPRVELMSLVSLAVAGGFFSTVPLGMS